MYGEPINIETAKKVAAGAIAEAKKRNWNGLCVAVVGPLGELVYFEKQDNCRYSSISISQHKARTAARSRRPTPVFERLLGKSDFYAYFGPHRFRPRATGDLPHYIEFHVDDAAALEMRIDWQARPSRSCAQARQSRRALAAYCRDHARRGHAITPNPCDRGG
jgi:Haem-degrading